MLKWITYFNQEVKLELLLEINVCLFYSLNLLVVVRQLGCPIIPGAHLMVFIDKIIAGHRKHL